MPTTRVRVIDLETAGNGANDVCEIGWQDVVLDDGDRWVVTEERGARLVDRGRPISTETMTVHHILDDQVVDAPHWKEVALGILRPDGGVIALAAQRAAFEQRYCTPRLAGGRPGSAPGNARCVFGQSSRDSPTRCYDISVGLK